MASSYDYDAWADEGKRSGKKAKPSQKVVTLDGVAIPLVDPQNFSEFWDEREERRRLEKEEKRELQHVAHGVGSDANLKKEKSLSHGSAAQKSNAVAYAADSDSSSPVSFYSASHGYNQGAVAIYGEGVSETSDFRERRPSDDRMRARVRPRPQSAQRTRSTTGATSSGMSSNVGSRSRRKGATRARPQSAQPIKRYRNRPASAGRTRRRKDYGLNKRRSANTSPKRGSEEDRQRVLEDYAKSIKAQRKMRPTSSSQYIKLRAAKRRAEARSFASSLAAEEKRRKIEVKAQVKEANKWSIMLNSGHSYTLVEDENAGVFGMAIKVLKPLESLSGSRRGTQGHTQDPSNQMSQKISIAAFQREHARIKIEMDRNKALQAISSGGRGRNRAGASSVGNGGEEMEQSGGGAKKHVTGRSRTTVQNELKSILKDTEKLTVTLVSQLRELKSCGWNVGYL